MLCTPPSTGIRGTNKQPFGEYYEGLSLIKKRKLRWVGHVSTSYGLSKTIRVGTVKEKEEHADGRRGRKTILKSGQQSASFSDLHLSLSDGLVKTKIYDKRDDLEFDIVNFPFLVGDVPRSTSYGVYISQNIRFPRVCSQIDGFNTRNKVLTVKRLRQG